MTLLEALEPEPEVVLMIAGAKELDPDEAAGDFEIEFSFEVPNVVGIKGGLIPVPVLINL